MTDRTLTPLPNERTVSERCFNLLKARTTPARTARINRIIRTAVEKRDKENSEQVSEHPQMMMFLVVGLRLLNTLFIFIMKTLLELKDCSVGG